jgi:cell division protein FtsB
MNSVPDADRLPTWFVRLMVATALAWAVTLAGQLIAGAWWGATISAKVDSIERLTSQAVGQHEREIQTLQEDIKVLDDKIANMKKDLAVLLDRGGSIRVKGD